MSNLASQTLNEAGSLLSLYSTAILSIMFSTLLVFMATKRFTLATGGVTVLISGIVFLLASNATGQNLSGSLPFSTYPIPPHLGLGDVSLENHYPSRISGGGPTWAPPYPGNNINQ